MDIQFYSQPGNRIYNTGGPSSFLIGKLYSRGREVSRVDVETPCDGDCAWITQVYTTHEFRGMGYATHLMCYLLQSYSDAYSEWRLSVTPFGDVPSLSEEELIAFYSHFGFELLSNALVLGSPVLHLTQANLKTQWFKHRYPPLDSDFFD